MLLAGSGGDLGGADADRLVELGEGLGLGFELGVGQCVDHALHDAGDRVVRGEVVLGEESVEDRGSDQVLREHACRFVLGNRVVEVTA